jgi:hypothetical protein
MQTWILIILFGMFCYWVVNRRDTPMMISYILVIFLITMFAAKFVKL